MSIKLKLFFVCLLLLPTQLMANTTSLLTCEGVHRTAHEIMTLRIGGLVKEEVSERYEVIATPIIDLTFSTLIPNNINKSTVAKKFANNVYIRCLRGDFIVL